MKSNNRYLGALMIAPFIVFVFLEIISNKTTRIIPARTLDTKAYGLKKIILHKMINIISIRPSLHIHMLRKTKQTITVTGSIRL